MPPAQIFHSCRPSREHFTLRQVPQSRTKQEHGVKKHSSHQQGLLELPGAPVIPAAGQTAGIDEAGRGCLAGPVVAGAVILPPEYDLPGLADSKACTARQRDLLAPCIKKSALAWGLGIVWPDRIDRINILQATFEAMSMAVRHLRITPQILLVDGNKVIPEPALAPQWLRAHGDTLPLQRAIVGGDAAEPAISAASILAKTCRDTLMTSLDKRWPGYGFAIHKGYGTKEHYEALRRLGPCPQHRLTFRGVCKDCTVEQEQGCLL